MRLRALLFATTVAEAALEAAAVLEARVAEAVGAAAPAGPPKAAGGEGLMASWIDWSWETMLYFTNSLLLQVGSLCV